MTKKLLFVVVIILAAVLAFWFFSMRGMMNSGAGGAMMEPEMIESNAGGAMVKITLPATLTANAEIGKRIFDVKCAACHGTNAVGQNGVAPPLVHKIYEPSHHGDFAFIRAAQNGVRAHHWGFGNMPPIEGVTDGDIKMVTTYIRELQRANGIN